MEIQHRSVKELPWYPWPEDMVAAFPQEAVARAEHIQLLLTDNDGVLTDNGVYYGEHGELMKRFSIRDGMGAARLRMYAGVDVGIITGERSSAVVERARKMEINELHLGIQDKPLVVRQVAERRGLSLEQIAYIGDDTNDVAVMKMVGLAACPSDAMPFARRAAHYVCEERGGQGAFRAFAELLLYARTKDL